MRETIKMLQQRLTPIYGKGEADAMIRLIFHSLKGWNVTDILVNQDKPLSDFMKSEISRILARLEKNEPIQYILGEAYFYGMDLKASPGVLIPRQDTEGLVDIIVDANPQTDLRVLDIATGSGCIAIALARNLKFPEVSALDVSDKAIALAKENAEAMDVKLTLIHADIFTWQPPESAFDIIVSNPPYIDESERPSIAPNVKDYEPAEALFVPDDNPLLFYKRIAAVAQTALSPGGRLYFEINPRHADALKAMLAAEGFTDIGLSRDIHGNYRYLACVYPKQS